MSESDEESKALMLSTSAAYPYNGQLPLSFSHESGARLDLVLRAGHRLPPDRSWSLMLKVHEALASLTAQSAAEYIDGLWERIQTLPEGALSSWGTTDLSCFAVAVDEQGHRLWGFGLGGVLGLSRGSLRSVLPPEHPAVGPAGLPKTRPADFLPGLSSPRYAAWCSSESQPRWSKPFQVLQHCGVS